MKIEKIIKDKLVENDVLAHNSFQGELDLTYIL